MVVEIRTMSIFSNRSTDFDTNATLLTGCAEGSRQPLLERCSSNATPLSYPQSSISSGEDYNLLERSRSWSSIQESCLHCNNSCYVRRCLSRMACSQRQWKQIAVDLVLTVSALIFVACSGFGAISPQHRGFYCDDRTIKYSYHGDTITIGVLFLINLGLPFLIFILVETWQYSGDGQSSLSDKGVKPCLLRLGRVVMDFLNGMLFTLFLTEFLKLIVSELRPHFIDTCRPNVNITKCSNEYIENYTCTSSFSTSLVKDSFKSFPSGHASLSFYSSLFVILYMQVRGRNVVSRFLCPWIQLLLLSWACYCGISRITDNRHHWWDVLVGGSIGAIIGYASVVVMGTWFRVPGATPTQTEESANSQNRVSGTRLLSTSSAEQKDVEPLPAIKDLELNHVP